MSHIGREAEKLMALPFPVLLLPAERRDPEMAQAWALQRLLELGRNDREPLVMALWFTDYLLKLGRVNL